MTGARATRDSGVTPPVTGARATRDSGVTPPVTLNAVPVTGGSHEGLEGKEGEREKEAPAAKPAAVAAKSTALPHSLNSNPAQFDEIEFSPSERVQWLMDYTIDGNVPNGSKAGYSKTAQAELIAKLRARTDIIDEELIFAVKEQIKKCTDKFSYNKFGTDLAANLYRLVSECQGCEEIADGAVDAKNDITQVAEDLSLNLVNVLEARGMSQGTKAAEDWLRRAIDCRARFAKAQHLVCPKCSGKEIYIHETGAFFCDGDCKDQSFIVPVKPASETVGKN